MFGGFYPPMVCGSLRLFLACLELFSVSWEQGLSLASSQGLWVCPSYCSGSHFLEWGDGCSYGDIKKRRKSLMSFDKGKQRAGRLLKYGKTIL
jgi:hypothetical protein